MLYILVAAVVIYFAQRHLIKKLEDRRGRRSASAETQRLRHAMTAKRHLYCQHVFRFFEPLKTSKYELGKKFSDINFQLFSPGDAACLFIAQKIWIHMDQDENSPTRNICNSFLDTVAQQLQEIEGSEEFKKLPKAYKCLLTEPSIHEYKNRSEHNNLHEIPDFEMQAAFSMCLAATKIMGENFDRASRDKMLSIEGIPGGITGLERFLNQRQDDVALWHQIVLLDGYSLGDTLLAEQRLYLLERIFSGLQHTVYEDVPDSVKQQRYDRLTPAQLGPNFVTTAYMAKCLYKWRNLDVADHPYNMMHALNQRIRADRVAAITEVDLDRFNEVTSMHVLFFPEEVSKSSSVDSELGPLTDEEVLVLAGLMNLSAKYKFNRRLSEGDNKVVQFADAKGLVDELDRQLELVTRESKISPEERAALQAQKMETRLEQDPFSAVLRPQVPIRFDEAPRSWLGGLPQMPAKIDWPRGGSGTLPMHFAAQICCADLPKELWRGKGPREGWLLLFIDGYRMGNYDGFDGDYPDGWAKVIHIDELGPEHSPPADILGVHDRNYAGADHDDALDDGDVPTVWRKWPIDIVPQKVELEPGKVVSFTSRDFALKSTTGQELYGVDDNGVSDKLMPEACPPLTWAGALSFAKCAIKQQKKHADATYLDRTSELRAKPGWTAPLISKLQEDLQGNGGLQSGHRGQLERTLALLLRHTDEDAERALSEKITDDTNSMAGWWADQSSRLNAFLEEIKAQDPNAQLLPEEWSDLNAQFAGIRQELLQIGVSQDGSLGRARLTDLNIVDGAWPASVVRQHYLDLYAQSAEAQDLIPPAAQEVITKIVREVKWGRPHRIGGLADPLQSEIGPDDPPLLFQIASDDSLNWMWGDAGAIFIHTTEQELSERVFSVFANMECH